MHRPRPLYIEYGPEQQQLRPHPPGPIDEEPLEDEMPVPIGKPVYTGPVRPRDVEAEDDETYQRYQDSARDFLERRRIRQDLIKRTNERMKSVDPLTGSPLTTDQYKRLKHLFQEASDAYLMQDLKDKENEYDTAREKTWKSFSKKWEKMSEEQQNDLVDRAIDYQIAAETSTLQKLNNLDPVPAPGPIGLSEDEQIAIMERMISNPKESAFNYIWATRQSEFFPTKWAHHIPFWSTPDIATVETAADAFKSDPSKDFGTLPYLQHRQALHELRGAVWVVDPNRGVVEGFVEYSDKLEAYVISFKGTNFHNMNDVFAADGRSQFFWHNIDRIDIPSAEEGVPPTSRGLPFTMGFNRGFWKRFEALWPEVYKALRTVVANEYAKSGLHDPEVEQGKLPTVLNRPVVITGHSLGGALAEICASVLAQLFPQWDIQLQPVSPARGLSDIDAFDRDPVLQRLYDNADRYYGNRDPVPAAPVGHRYHVGYREHLLNAPSGFTGTSVARVDPSAFGNHYRENLWAMIRNLDPRRYAPDNTPRVVTTYGEGKTGSKQTSQVNREEMKQRMAYARSFRKKKMN